MLSFTLNRGRVPPDFNVQTPFHLKDLITPDGLRVGFGTNRLGALGKRDRFRLLGRVWELGVRHFDTAPLYGSGDAERWLGEFLGTGKPEATITTKCGLYPPIAQRSHLLRDLARMVRRISGPIWNLAGKWLRKPRTDSEQLPLARTLSEYRQIASDLEASLEVSLTKLRRDHVDVFAIHEPDAGILEADEILMKLVKLKTAGKTRGIAAAGHFHSLLPIAKSDGLPFDLYQFEHDIAGRNLSLWREAGLPSPIVFGAVAATGADGGKRDDQTASALMKAALESNPDGLVLFSTTKVTHAGEILTPLVA